MKKATYEEGMLFLYDEIVRYLNTKYYRRYEASEVYEFINQGYFTVYGEKKSMDEVKPIIEAHINNVMNKIHRAFDVGSVDNVFLIGGGAESMQSYIKQYIPNLHIEKNSQFTNAECFEYLGSIKLKG